MFQMYLPYCESVLNDYVARNGEAVSVPMADRLSFRGQTNAQSNLKRWSSR